MTTKIKKQQKERKSRGQVLFLVLLVSLMFLSTAILSNMMLTNQTFTESRKFLDFLQSYWIAEAGIQQGIKNVNKLNQGVPLNGKIMAISWNSDEPVPFGAYMVKKISEDRRGISLESTGTTDKNLTTRVLTTKLDKQSLRINSFNDRFSP